MRAGAMFAPDVAQMGQGLPLYAVAHDFRRKIPVVFLMGQEGFLSLIVIH